MQYTPAIRQIDGKDYIFCAWRRQMVRLTPEEWIRQHFLHALTEDFGYPQALIAVETLLGGNQRTRTDAVVYDRELRPICLLEFKAPTVALTQKVYDQVANYNRHLQVEIFILSNGKEHVACRVTDKGYERLPHIPLYDELIKTGRGTADRKSIETEN